MFVKLFFSLLLIHYTQAGIGDWWDRLKEYWETLGPKTCHGFKYDKPFCAFLFDQENCNGNSHKVSRYSQVHIYFVSYDFI